MTHYTSEASPQTDQRVVKCRCRWIAPVACIELGVVNHSVEWDRRKANRLAVKAPRNRSRDERTTDCRRGVEQARCLGSREYRSNVPQCLCTPTPGSRGHIEVHSDPPRT